jgi:hypothetical protein
MSDLKPYNIYTLCSQEKNCFFNVRFEALLYIYSQEKKVIFFQCGIWNPLVDILHVSKKKLFFQYGIWNAFVYILYVHKKKSYVFSMWDKKLFGLNTSI